MEKKVIYQNDIFENTPLDYAVKKNAKKCVELILNNSNSTYGKCIIESLTQDDFCRLLKYSPSTITQFVDSLTIEIQ